MSALQSTLPIVENKTLRLYKFFTYLTLTLSGLALLLVVGVVSGLLSDTVVSGIPASTVSVIEVIKQSPFNFTMAIVLFSTLLISWLIIRYEKKKSALSLDFVVDASEFTDEELAEFLKDQSKTKGIRYKLVKYIFLRRKLKDPACGAQRKQKESTELLRESLADAEVSAGDNLYPSKLLSEIPVSPKNDNNKANKSEVNVCKEYS